MNGPQARGVLQGLDHGTRLFPETKWAEIADRVADAFRMGAEEREWFRNKEVAKLIASIPFLAGCDDAERTAVAHVGTYLLSIKETKPYFNASSGDDGSIFDRLRLIAQFKGGNPAIIDRGMSLLALNMIIDYRRDAAEDVVLGKHNPVSSGSFDSDAIIADLKRRIEGTPCPEMETIFDSTLGPLAWWAAN